MILKAICDGLTRVIAGKSSKSWEKSWERLNKKLGRFAGKSHV
jgi:hypothetical protein